MSASKYAAAAERLHGLPADDEGPVFSEGWEADLFAVALALADGGLFSWTEWTEALTAAIAAAQAAGDPDHGDTYYHHWLAALEGLCRAKGVVDRDAVDRRQDAWRQAYENTPHGQPVELAAAWRAAEDQRLR